ncbi:MAG: phage terminase large subunit [Caenibius sp.]
MSGLPYPENPAEFLRQLRQRDFLAFLERAWPHICGGQPVLMNWHIEAIALELERIASGKSRRLIVNLPPRNGKSLIISVAWIAWQLGRDPSLNFVCVSYSNELSAKLARECLSLMQSEWYKDVFPGTVISQRRSASYDFETTRGGGRLSTSVGGTLTGRGGDILVLDDVIKPEDANSEVVREAVNEWYRSTLVSRLNDKSSGAIICVMQRLHQFDLCGMLLESGGWNHLSLPAIAPDDAVVPLLRGRAHKRRTGDILHPAREPVEVLDELRASMGTSAFAAQYLQDPVPAIGNIFRHVWLRISPADLTSNSAGEIVQSWDTATKTGNANDYSVCITALMRRKEIHILNVWRGRLEFPELVKKCVSLSRTHGAATMLVEDKASGQELIQTLRWENHRGVPAPIARTPVLDKFSRAEGISSIIEAGQLFLPEEAPWLAEFKSELLAFPNGKYDDQVDALTQLLNWARTKWSYQPPTNAGGTFITFDDNGVIDAVGEDAALFTNPARYNYDDDPWGA